MFFILFTLVFNTICNCCYGNCHISWLHNNSQINGSLSEQTPKSVYMKPAFLWRWASAQLSWKSKFSPGLRESSSLSTAARLCCRAESKGERGYVWKLTIAMYHHGTRGVTQETVQKGTGVTFIQHHQRKLLLQGLHLKSAGTWSFEQVLDQAER